jgi:hypothetical protein
VVLHLDDSESVVGVRTASGSMSPIGSLKEGVFRWEPRGEGDQLMILLRHEPEAEIRISLAGVMARDDLSWSELGSKEAPTEVAAGGHRARLFRREARPETVTRAADEGALREQLKALGYIE